MLFATVRAAPRSTTRRLGLIAAVTAATFMLSFTSLAATAHASSARVATDTATSRTAAAHTAVAAAAKKVVIVVGPVGSQTADYISSAKAIAKVFTTAGMDVHLILPPHATWSAVVSAANGADFFAYLGHGNGWPSPYPPFNEDKQDGIGLNPTDGDTNTYNVKYYGAKLFKAAIVLAPNAIVLLNRLCYSAGNAEPGMTLPNQTVALQRVDNFASGFLAAGARTVFALGWQPGVDLANAIVKTHQTMDNFFEWADGPNTDPRYQPWKGWIGWKPNVYLNSKRTPGATVHLDPSATLGYLRAVTGDLSFTTDMWWSGGNSTDTTPPTVSQLAAGVVTNTSPAGGDTTPVFTPNGDGLSDVLTINHTLSEPSYLDISIARTGGAVVRDFTSYSDQGATNTAWDGTSNTGSVVSDGTYTITVTPKDRAGNVGSAVSTRVKVLTAMWAPKATPNQFYAADGDTLAQTQAQKVTLTQPATLTWVVTDRSGVLVRTAMTDQTEPVGLVTWSWDGKDDAGAYVPDGAYFMRVTAVTAQGSYSQEIRVYVSPFKITTNTWTATAGQSIKMTILTAEPQAGWPKMTVTQPGVPKYSVSLRMYSSTKFTATITFKSGGTPGPVTIKIVGTDTKGGVDTRSYTATIQ